MNPLKEIYNICHGIGYNRDVPKEAEKLAKNNNIIIIVGGSDDLMYCYGAKSYLTAECEHLYGWDGEDFSDIEDEKLLNEVNQLGLKIWWCGLIQEPRQEKPNYKVTESGAFSYSVNPEIEYLEFLVCENENDFSDIYCTGIIIRLPEDFKPSI